MLTLCSRNGHDQNVLVRRVQWDQARVPFPERKNKRAWKENERETDRLLCSHNAQSRRMKRKRPSYPRKGKWQLELHAQWEMNQTSLLHFSKCPSPMASSHSGSRCRDRGPRVHGCLDLWSAGLSARCPKSRPGSLCDRSSMGRSGSATGCSGNNPDHTNR